MSKVLPPGPGVAARPMVWRRAGQSAAADASPPPPQETAGAGEELARQIAELERQAEAREYQARQAGYRDGEAAGMRAAEAALGPVLERLARSIEELALLRPTLVAQAEAELLKLSIAIARRILHREITLDPDALGGIIQAALEKVQIHEVRSVCVHPAHVAALRAALDRLPAARSVEVRQDGGLECGGVVVETGRGKLDASLETQLSEIERGLADRLRRRA